MESPGGNCGHHGVDVRPCMNALDLSPCRKRCLSAVQGGEFLRFEDFENRQKTIWALRMTWAGVMRDSVGMGVEPGHAGVSPAGHSQAAPRTPLASPCRAGRIGVATPSEKHHCAINGGTSR